MRLTFMTAALAMALLASPSVASDTWSELREQVFGDAVPVVNAEVVRLDAPYRTYNDPRTDIGAHVSAPLGEFIKSVSLIIDENPMPVSAVFELAEPKRAFAFSGSMRINGPSMVRIVAETDRGNFYMQETFVKTSGTGACSAPPGTDPLVALETMGTMKFKLLPGDGESVLASLEKPAQPQSGVDMGRLVQLDMDHPSHSGMQMDQITLLFIPARYVDTIEVQSNGEPLFTMTGSISFSENPAIRFEVPQDALGVGVKMTDTEGATFEETFTMPGG